MDSPLLPHDDIHNNEISNNIPGHLPKFMSMTYMTLIISKRLGKKLKYPLFYFYLLHFIPLSYLNSKLQMIR